MNTRRRLAAGVLLLALMTGLAAPANAYVKTRDVGVVGTKQWIYFNQVETANIAAGGGACATIVGRVPLIGIPAGIVCSLIGSAAAIARANDACIGLYTWKPHGVQNAYGHPFYHNRSYCR